MPYKEIDDGHRISLAEEDVIAHTKRIFEQGLQLEAILLAHEYLEQNLNALYKQSFPMGSHTTRRKFKQIIELLRFRGLLTDENYCVLNEFNRLRNINSNRILDFSLTLRGAKKGDMVKAMSLAEECMQIIVDLFQDTENSHNTDRKRYKGKKK